MIKKKKQNTPTFPIHQWGTNEYGFPTNNEHNWKSASSISKKASKNKPRKTVYKAISGNIYTTEKEAINDNERYLSDPSYRFSYKSTNFPHYDPLFIPFIENKRVTLSDAGLATGAIISTNLLDSIAKYAEQTGLPIKTALGLATKESTLGNPTDDSSVVKLIGKDKALMMQRGQTGQHLNTTGAAIDARELVNYYKDTWNPYEVALEIADEKSRKLVPAPDGNVYDSKGNIVGTRFYHDDSGYEEYRQEKELADNKRRQIFNDILLSGEKYADNLAEKYKDKIKGNILEAAFTDYKNNPHGYNSGQPNYSELVERRASEVWNSPEIQAWYNDYKNQKADGGSLNSKTWDNLSMAEKSEMMRVAIENGITTLPEIKEAYNEFAKGGYAPSRAIKDRITAYEGKAMTGAKDPVTGKWGKNNSFESEATRFYNVLPENIREQVLSNPELADNLYSYSYNVGAGNFKKRVVPALERYYAGEGSIKDIENSMWASNDAKLRGLQRRRAEEKEGVRNALLGEVIPSLSTEQELPAFMPSNPQAFFAPLESYQRPVVIEEPLVQAAMENPYSPEQLEREERAQGLRNLGLAMSIMRGGQEQSYSPLWSAVSMLSGNQMTKGGKIHIKPENRGKFTALKKRTGHSATWFKEHGTPAQKKMATFALNAKKWKHGLGGNLFSGEDNPTQQMNNNGLNLYRRTNNLGETEYIYQETPDSEEILLTPTNKRFSDDPTNWDYKDASGRKYSPRMTTTYNPGELREDTRGPLERMVDNYFGELKYQVNNNVPISGKYTMPAIAAPLLAPLGEAFAGTTIAGVPATTWANTAMAAGFAGHGLNHTINEGINGWGDAAMTALELAPLGGLARPMFNRVALAVENYRYPFGRPQVPEGYITVKPQIRTRVGDVEVDNPNVLYHTDWGDGIGAMAKINESQGIPTHGGPIIIDGFLYPGASYTEGQKAYTWWNLGKPWNTPSSGSRLTTTNVDNPLLFSVRSSKEPIGQWNGRKGFVTKNEYVANEPVDVSNSTYVFKPNYGWRRVFTEETPTADWPMSRTAPQITAENAASITPEQWTAAQDAAIARGNMAEAQRLRDLHFQVSAPNTVASVNGQPLQLYHGTDATFNTFDISKYGNTDGGTFGRGVYTTPVKTYAELYGKNNMPLYMKLDNPRDYRNSSIGDLIAEKFAFGDDFATGNGIDGVIGRPSWKGFKGLEEYVSHNPKNIKSSLPITYDDNGVRIPLGERDNFNINDIRYFKDDFGKEVLITPYPGTDAQLIDAANEGHLAALRHQFSQDKTEQLKSVMGWDDAAIAEYQDEILRSFGSPADIQVRGTDTGFKEIGNHAGNISQNGESVSHSMTLNRDRIPDDATAIEAGIHEMGVHGRTLSIDPSEIGVEGSYSNTIAQKFPRIAEVMKKNQEIAKQTLIPNDEGKLFQQIKKSSDLERWLYENNVPVEQWEKYFNDWKYYKYVTEDQELLARGYTGQVYETIDPSREALNIQQLKKFFTPESTEKYKKAVLSALPFLFTGYGISQGNE